MRLRNDNPGQAVRDVFGPGDVPMRRGCGAEELPNNEKYEKMTPKEVVQAFFDACEKENWDEAQQFLDSSLSRKDLQSALEGRHTCPC